MQYAASVDGVFFRFEHGPLGLLPDNARWSPSAPAVCTRRGVRLYQWTEAGACWRLVRWPAHLWWTRFLLSGHVLTCGTRHEGSGHWRVTARIHRWWLERTDAAQREAWFADPDVRRLGRELRREAPRLVPHLLRTWAAVRLAHPEVLRACPDPHPDLAYTAPVAARAVQDLATQLDAETPACTTVAYAYDCETFADLLLRRSGARLADVLAGAAATVRQTFLPGATVRRLRSVGCSVLDYDRRAYISLTALETLWHDFAVALAAVCRRACVVLLDAPMARRREWHRAVVQRGAAAWLTDSAASAANLYEEVGVTADTVAYYNKQRQHWSDAGADVLLVDGMQRLGLAQQTALLRRVPPATRLLVLAGDTAGRVYHRALDGWTLCCHAARHHRAAAAADVLAAGPGLRVCIQEPPTTTLLDEPWTEAADGGGGRRWLHAPVANGQLVSWVCQTVPIPCATMLVVNGGAMPAVVRGDRRALPGLALCDHSPVHEGQEVRCVVPGRRLRFGAVYRVLDATVRLQPLSGARTDAEVVAVTPAELQAACRPARLGTLAEHGNSHYAQRSVLVVMNHRSGGGGPWDPLYTALSLGTAHNVTVVANRGTLDAVTKRLREVLSAPQPDIPPVWQAFVDGLLQPLV